MAISMLKIRRPLGRLIFNMGIAIPGKTVFLIETAPRCSGQNVLVEVNQYHCCWCPASLCHQGISSYSIDYFSINRSLSSIRKYLKYLGHISVKITQIQIHYVWWKKLTHTGLVKNCSHIILSLHFHHLKCSEYIYGTPTWLYRYIQSP